MQQPVDYSRKWYVMAAVAMSIFLAAIDASIVNVALPTLVREFQVNFATVQWVVLAYLLVQTTLMLSVGRLGDMLGKKSIFIAGLIVFTAGSFLCGLSPAVYWLIAFRAVKAVGAAMILALGLALITEAFPKGERGKALGIGGTMVSIGVVAGPMLGGLIIETLSWRWIFFVNLPVGALAIWMANRYLPDFRPAGRQPFDYIGAITLLISLLGLLLALTWGQSVGFTAPPILALLGVWLLFLLIFIRHEWRAPFAMVDLRLFRSRLFSVNLTTGFIVFVCLGGLLILLPFYLEDVLGYSNQQVGLLMAILPLFFGLTTPVAGAISDRIGARPMTVIGLFLIMIGYLAASTLDQETSAWGYLLRLAPLGIGVGVFQSPNNSAVMGTAVRERLGIASGLLAIMRTLGQTAGISILGAVWAGRVILYQGFIPDGGATRAAEAAQIAGLQDTFVLGAALTLLALAMAGWSWRQERRQVEQANTVQACA